MLIAGIKPRTKEEGGEILGVYQDWNVILPMLVHCRYQTQTKDEGGVMEGI